MENSYSVTIPNLDDASLVEAGLDNIKIGITNY